MDTESEVRKRRCSSSLRLLWKRTTCTAHQNAGDESSDSSRDADEIKKKPKKSEKFSIVTFSKTFWAIMAKSYMATDTSK